MATTRYSSKITYDTKDNHPDAPGLKGQEFTDIYTIDTDAFYGQEDIQDYIKEDLCLVAGGGYDTDTIKNVKFSIKRTV